MEYEVQGPRPRGRPKRTWREVVKEDCQACKINKEDAADSSRWGGVHKGCLMTRIYVSGKMFLVVLADPDSPGHRAVKRLYVCITDY